MFAYKLNMGYQRSFTACFKEKLVIENIKLRKPMKINIGSKSKKTKTKTFAIQQIEQIKDIAPKNIKMFDIPVLWSILSMYGTRTTAFLALSSTLLFITNKF